MAFNQGHAEFCLYNSTSHCPFALYGEVPLGDKLRNNDHNYSDAFVAAAVIIILIVVLYMYVCIIIIDY